MTSTNDVPKTPLHPRGRGDIFDMAGLDAVEFYTNASKINDEQIQQQEIMDLNPQIEPLRIELLSDKKGRYVGKNLLDSFALIFARPGGPGVAATVLECSAKDPNTYTLWLATNDGAKSYSLRRLAKDIEDWFKNRALYEYQDTLPSDHPDNPDPKKDLWASILTYCYPSIVKFIQDTYKILNEFRETLNWIESAMDLFTPSEEQRAAHDGITRILNQLKVDFGNRLRTNAANGSPDENWIDDDPSDRVERFNKITQLCFQELECHELSIGEIFQGLIEPKNEEEIQKHDREERIRKETWPRKENTGICKENTWRQWDTQEITFEKFRRLIYVIANYRRAWYNLVHFKAQGSNYILQIRTISMPEGQRHLPRTRLFCGMQILEFLLESDHPNNFFSYIGCSKGPCWFSYHTLKCVAPEFEMREPNLKIYNAWGPPKVPGDSSYQHRLIKVLRILDEKMREAANKGGNLERRAALPDTPDVEKRFVSLRTD
ncbi:hypothetical protein F4821DRAFT_276575 [Hypoxylon rubiginosum]|uniref:Uncharacterized protein n=1 Tax=Hypoxylon rubiginosum TaxID=110542 RepID=A0ACC0D8G5_9PEZI|nr:hypothetical protein F4821DRAFT_276575 [Hypoxylon rubiginosum]